MVVAVLVVVAVVAKVHLFQNSSSEEWQKAEKGKMQMRRDPNSAQLAP